MKDSQRRAMFAKLKEYQVIWRDNPTFITTMGHSPSDVRKKLHLKGNQYKIVEKEY